MSLRLLEKIRRARDAIRDSFDDDTDADAPSITLPAVDAPSYDAATSDSPRRSSPQHDLEDLADVEKISPAFRALRVDWCGSAAAVTACVAELEGNTYAVFAKRGQLDSDIFRAVMARAAEAARGKAVTVYTVSPVVLLTLVRERMQADDLRHRNLRERSASGGRSAVRTGFHDLVSWAARKEASDLHLHLDATRSVSRVSATIDGQYITPANLAMPTERMVEMARVAWLDVVGGNGSFLDMAREQQGRLYEVVDDRNYMLRWGSFVADQGPSITLRLLDIDAKVEVIDLATLGFLPSQVEQFERVLLSHGGGIVLGGVPGAGKTVSMGQFLVRLPPTRKLMMMGDPIELFIDGALQASFARALDGSDAEVMQAKLMAIKRAAASDVDLGEIRDKLTGAAFQDILQSGSNGYATLHVCGMLDIPQRLASPQIGIPYSVLGSPRMLKLLGYQALLPVMCDCALPAQALFDGATDRMGIHRPGAWWKKYLGHIESLYDFGHQTMRVRNPEGCPRCRNKGIPELFGYRGRTAVVEFFEPGQDPDALRAITAGDTLRLHEIYAGRRTAAFDHPDMDGKTAMECGVYKMSQGILDPRDIEPFFVSFMTLKPGGKR